MSENANLPRHIGFIVDGNRRWAKQHGLPAYEGHLAGYNALKRRGARGSSSGREIRECLRFLVRKTGSGQRKKKSDI